MSLNCEHRASRPCLSHCRRGSGSGRIRARLRLHQLTGVLALQTIYNAITNGTPCVIVEGSGRVADVIAQVASLPVSDITIGLIQQKLSELFQELFETFTESRIVEWTKKVRRQSGHQHEATLRDKWAPKRRTPPGEPHAGLRGTVLGEEPTAPE